MVLHPAAGVTDGVHGDQPLPLRDPGSHGHLLLPLAAHFPEPVKEAPRQARSIQQAHRGLLLLIAVLLLLLLLLLLRQLPELRKVRLQQPGGQRVAAERSYCLGSPRPAQPARLPPPPGSASSLGPSMAKGSPGPAGLESRGGARPGGWGSPLPSGCSAVGFPRPCPEHQIGRASCRERV